MQHEPGDDLIERGRGGGDQEELGECRDQLEQAAVEGAEQTHGEFRWRKSRK